MITVDGDVKYGPWGFRMLKNEDGTDRLLTRTHAMIGAIGALAALVFLVCGPLLSQYGESIRKDERMAQIQAQLTEQKRISEERNTVISIALQDSRLQVSKIHDELLLLSVDVKRVTAWLDSAPGGTGRR